MARKQKLVHLTHHTCLANGIEVDTIYNRLYENSDGGRRNIDRYEKIYGSQARRPANFGPLHCRYADKTSLLTMDLEAVTCSTCLAAVENESRESLFEQASRRGIQPSDKRYLEERAEGWCDENELKVRAWLLCCRHVGAPCPITRQQAVKRLRAARANLVECSVKLATLLAFTWTGKSAERLAKTIAEMDPADRKLMRGAVERAKRVDALTKQADAIRKSIDRLAERAAKRIRKSAVIELPARVS